MNRSAVGRVIFVAGLWAVCIGIAFATRPLLPVDETRYLSVAWEMWRSADLLVPHLNGEPYSHKPPLLFWLIYAAWKLAGVSETVARAVPTLFALGTIGVTAWLAHLLWPTKRDLPAIAALILASFSVFTLFGSLVMFDAAVSFATALGMVALVKAASGRSWWWLLFALALAMGCLAKGPVVMAFLLPTAAAAPLWSKRSISARRWYPALLASTGAAAALVAWWALSAAAAGGPDYATALLWRQTAGRIVQSFAHRQPWWFYVAVLPVFFYPWGWWPETWRALRSATWADHGLRLVAFWFGGSILVLSAVSGKQLQYLLPVIPSAALCIARLLGERSAPVRALSIIGPMLPLLAIGVGLIVAPWLLEVPAGSSLERYFPPWFLRSAPTLGLAVLVGVGAILAVVAALRQRTLWTVAVFSLLFFVTAHTLANRVVFENYDLDDVAQLLNASDHEGVAVVGGYDGEFNFLARLTKPVAVLSNAEVRAWFTTHPRGQVVVGYRLRPDLPAHAPWFEQQYRGKWLGVWDNSTMAVDRP